MSDSPHEAIVDGCGARLATLALDGLEKRLYDREVIDKVWALNADLPGLVYGPPGTLEPLDELTDSLRDGWGYPVVLRIVDRQDAAQDPGRWRAHLKWQHRVRNAFHNQPLLVDFAGLQVVKGRVEAGVVVEQDLLAMDLVSLALVLSFRATEVRT